MNGPAGRLSGRIRVGLPPDEALRLFTPRGERDWVAGWSPRFPVPTTDDGAPGTVFETEAHGATTTWLVLARQPGRHISYARVTPRDRAGTVTVTVHGSGGHSEVEVTYALTALSDAAAGGLQDFADGYPAFLRSWQDAIEAWLSGPGGVRCRA
ncbi:hypothetical protein GCM10027176_67730 [Actinoallomurus bryophytorum]|uniref:Polyketide cyclase/dehydrase/lipid transport protein n=1 Tax=Actinoallomurus bryophytorum TaxID=1490222 RepID=A0A543BSN0_9ACTN|nr:SRPBCC family protein [Actinoallomurus bryophytorum]TQL87838.1 hypothetical protein FB559_8449 [Actinoallomurus bryophytorum]